MSEKQDDLLNYYPDLSDEDEELQKEEELPGSQPHKLIKPNENEADKPKTVFTAPRMFGGKAFIPPPPPPGAKKYNPVPPPPVQPPKSLHSPPDTSQIKNFSPEQAPMRQQRKNCLYVRNIPKHYNQVDKLMTFFRNQGQIKEIRVRHEDNSAVVRFIKEEHAMKFVNSKKAIFNRSFITYSLTEKETVPAELVKERQNQEAGKIKKPVEIEMKQLKQRIDAILSEKIRALLFLIKNILRVQIMEQLQKQLLHCIDQKNNVAKWSYEEISEASKMITNQYDWTIGYTLNSQGEVDKKTYSGLLHKKFGPISNIEITPLTHTSEQDPLPELPQEFIVKLTFVSPKQAWVFYFANQVYRKEGKQPEEKEIEIEGASLKSFLNEEIIKAPQIPQFQERPAHQHQHSHQAEALVEIDEHGQVRPVEAATIPQQSQPQVVHANQVSTLPQPQLPE